MVKMPLNVLDWELKKLWYFYIQNVAKLRGWM